MTGSITVHIRENLENEQRVAGLAYAIVVTSLVTHIDKVRLRPARLVLRLVTPFGG